MVGEDFESVLLRKYPGKLHAKRTLEQIRKKVSDPKGIVYLESTHEKLQEDNDSPVPFR
jgi:Xaa-Pro dipeptidase